MKVSYSNQIHWKNSHRNSFEEYCAVLPKLCGKKVKHYQQINDKNVHLAPQEKEKNRAKAIALKIVVLLSHLTLIVPLVMYLGKAIQRKIASLKIALPIDHVKPEHLDFAKEIRKLREDSQYVPNDHDQNLRFNLPADSILDELYLCSPEILEERHVEILEIVKKKYPEIIVDMPLNKGQFDPYFSLPKELHEKQKQILAPGFNDFTSVHGVEAHKGGVRNLLNILIEGVLRAKWSGRLEGGNGEYYAGPHGPYYIILDSQSHDASVRRKGIYDERAFVAILVPDERIRHDFLENGLNKAIERGWITEKEKRNSMKKVITYDEFIALPKSKRYSEKLLAAHLK